MELAEALERAGHHVINNNRKMKHYDYLIVGAGLYGSLIAYKAKQAEIERLPSAKIF